MRIVGGKFRGHRLVAPRGQATRPTTDRTRESLFNILNNRIEFQGLRIMDLFAGTGALGLEAMSRGGKFCLFVEEAAQPCAAIRANVDALGLNEETKIFRRDATRLGPVGAQPPFDLVFADPPYGKGLGERAAQCLLELNWIGPDAVFVLEEISQAFPARLNGFELSDRRDFGNTTIGIFHLAK